MRAVLMGCGQMAEVDLDSLDTKLAAEGARLVAMLRDLADQPERRAPEKAINALARVTGSIDDFAQRVRPLLR